MVIQQCSNFFDYGNPSANVSENSFNYVDQYLCRDGYISAYSYSLKIPVAVTYSLTPDKVNNPVERKDDFRPDPDVPTDASAQLSDYSNSGYDRDHNAPYDSMAFSQESVDQSFLLTNIAPQAPDLNRQGWEQVEEYVRKWKNYYRRLWVYTGGLFKKSTVHNTIGSNNVGVPDYFFKVIYAPDKLIGSQTIAFIMPNSKVSKKDVADYIVSIK